MSSFKVVKKLVTRSTTSPNFIPVISSPTQPRKIRHPLRRSSSTFYAMPASPPPGGDKKQTGYLVEEEATEDPVSEQRSSPAAKEVKELEFEQGMEGWLKKQVGLLRSWRRFWFVLSEDRLEYRADQSDGPPLGGVCVKDCTVLERPSSEDAPQKYLFDLTPDPRKQPPGGVLENYTLCAETDDDRYTWMSAIKHALPAGAIFGRRLEETLKFEQSKDRSRKVPHIVQMCVEFLRQHGLTTEGLFRTSGLSSRVRQLRDAFDSGVTPVFNRSDVTCVASLLKNYLMALPEPLIPFHLYEKVIDIAIRHQHLDSESRIFAFEHLLRTSMSIPNYEVLRYLCRFLSEVTTRADLNKMPAKNLAIIFSQSFIQPQSRDPASLLHTANERECAVLLMIDNVERLFEVKSSGDAISSNALVVDRSAAPVMIGNVERLFEVKSGNIADSNVAVAARQHRRSAKHADLSIQLSTGSDEVFDDEHSDWVAVERMDDDSTFILTTLQALKSAASVKNNRFKRGRYSSRRKVHQLPNSIASHDSVSEEHGVHSSVIEKLSQGVSSQNCWNSAQHNVQNSRIFSTSSSFGRTSPKSTSNRVRSSLSRTRLQKRTLKTYCSLPTGSVKYGTSFRNSDLNSETFHRVVCSLVFSSFRQVRDPRHRDLEKAETMYGDKTLLVHMALLSEELRR